MPWWAGLLISIGGGVLLAGLLVWITLSKMFRDF